MPTNSEATEPWDGDVNEAVLQEWKQETTAFDRVTTVVDATGEFTFASEIADRAEVSEPTARRHLESLTDAGRVTAVAAEGGTKYKRSSSTIAMRRIAGLHSAYSKEGLQEAIGELREKIAALRDKYGVSDADDLATELEHGDDSWTAVARMRELEENLDIAKAALNLYDFDPDRTGGAATVATEAADATEDETGRQSSGAFAGSESRAA